MKAKYIRVRSADNATEISTNVDTFDYERKFDDFGNTRNAYHEAVNMIAKYGFCFSNFTYLNGQVYFFLTEDRKFMNNNAMKNYGWWKHRNRKEYNVLLPTIQTHASSWPSFNTDSHCKITGNGNIGSNTLTINYFSDYAFLSGYNFTNSNEYEFPFTEPELLKTGSYVISAELENGISSDGNTYSTRTGDGFDIEYCEHYGFLVLKDEYKLDLTTIFDELDFIFRIKYTDGTTEDVIISRDEWRIAYIYYKKINITKEVESASIVIRMKMTSSFSTTVPGMIISFTSLSLVPLEFFTEDVFENTTSETLGPVAITCSKIEEFEEQVVPLWLRMESVPYFLKDEPEIMDTYASTEQGSFALNKTGVTITERTEEVSELVYITEKALVHNPYIEERYVLSDTFLNGNAIKREYDITIDTVELMKNSSDTDNDLANSFMTQDTSVIGYNDTGIGSSNVISYFGLHENGKSYYDENNFTTLKTGPVTDKVYTALSSPLFTCELNLFDVYYATGRDYSTLWMLNPHDFELTYQILVDGVDVTDSDVSIRMTAYDAKGSQVAYCVTQWGYIPSYQEGSDTNWSYGYNGFVITNTFDYERTTYRPEDVEDYSVDGDDYTNDINTTMIFTDRDAGNPKTTFIRHVTNRNFDVKSDSPVTTFVFTIEPHTSLYGKVIEIKNFSVVYLRRFSPVQLTVQSREKDSEDDYADSNVLNLGTHVSLMDSEFKLISRGNIDMSTNGRRIETINDVGTWSSDWRCGIFAADIDEDTITEDDYPNTSIVAIRSTILEKDDIVFFKQHGFETDTYNTHANPFYTYDKAYGKLGALSQMSHDNMYIKIVDLNSDEVLYTSPVLGDGGFYKADKDRTVNIEICINNTKLYSSNYVYIDGSRLILDLIKSSNVSTVKTLELPEICELNKIKVDYIKDTVGLTRMKKNFDVDISMDGKKWIGVLRHRGKAYLPSISANYNENSFYCIRNLKNTGTSIDTDDVLGDLSARYIRVSPSSTAAVKHVGIHEVDNLQDSASEFFSLQIDKYYTNGVNFKDKFGMLISALSVIKDGELLSYSISTLSKLNEEIEIYTPDSKKVSLAEDLLEVSEILNSEKGSMYENIYIKSITDSVNINVGLVVDLGSVKSFDNVSVIQNFGGFSSVPEIAATDDETFMYLMPTFLGYGTDETISSVISALAGNYSQDALTIPAYFNSFNSTGEYWRQKLLCESRIRCRIMSAFSIQISTDGETWTEIQDENLSDFIATYGNDTMVSDIYGDTSSDTP